MNKVRYRGLFTCIGTVVTKPDQSKMHKAFFFRLDVGGERVTIMLPEKLGFPVRLNDKVVISGQIRYICKRSTADGFQNVAECIYHASQQPYN